MLDCAKMQNVCQQTAACITIRLIWMEMYKSVWIGPYTVYLKISSIRSEKGVLVLHFKKQVFLKNTLVPPFRTASWGVQQRWRYNLFAYLSYTPKLVVSCISLCASLGNYEAQPKWRCNACAYLGNCMATSVGELTCA